MQRAVKPTKAAKQQKVAKPTKIPTRSKSTLVKTPVKAPVKSQIQLNYTLPALAPLSFTSPFTQQTRGMAKGGKNDKDKGKGDKKASGGDAAAGGVAFSGAPFQDKMKSFVEAYTNELSNVKVGRATPEMLHDIVVESAGKKVQLKSVSQIYVKPPASLVVSLHEPTDALEKSVLNAISGAGMDLNPISEALHGIPSIVVPFPKPTKELRESLIKLSKTKAEETKINIRNQRKLWNDAVKKAGLPKDDAFREEKNCQKETDAQCDIVADLCSKKEKEINAV